jgi:copper homeostasis protein (lipoprotein)
MNKVVIMLMLTLLFSCASLTHENKNHHQGYFSYLADAAIFIDCETKERYPVAMEGAYITMEKKYLEISETDGQKILVRLDGEFIERNKIEGEGKQKFLVVNKFIEFMPNESCD